MRNPQLQRTLVAVLGIAVPLGLAVYFVNRDVPGPDVVHDHAVGAVRSTPAAAAGDQEPAVTAAERVRRARLASSKPAEAADNAGTATSSEGPGARPSDPMNKERAATGQTPTARASDSGDDPATVPIPPLPQDQPVSPDADDMMGDTEVGVPSHAGEASSDMTSRLERDKSTSADARRQREPSAPDEPPLVERLGRPGKVTGAVSVRDIDYSNPRDLDRLPLLVDGTLVAGSKDLQMSNAVERGLTIRGLESTEARARICADETGAVRRVVLTDRSVVPEANDAIRSAIRSWRYEPYVVGERASGFCEIVTFAFKR